MMKNISIQKMGVMGAILKVECLCKKWGSITLISSCRGKNLLLKIAHPVRKFN